MQLVETVTVGSGGASSITFSNIPQTGKNLLILGSARDSYADIFGGFYAAFNGSTANRTNRFLFGNGSTVSSNTSTEAWAGWSTGSSATSNTFGNLSFYVANYTLGQSKLISTDAVTANTATTSYQGIVASRWADNAAITSITITPLGTFQQHSSASLYIIN